MLKVPKAVQESHGAQGSKRSLGLDLNAASNLDIEEDLDRELEENDDFGSDIMLRVENQQQGLGRAKDLQVVGEWERYIASLEKGNVHLRSHCIFSSKSKRGGSQGVGQD